MSDSDCSTVLNENTVNVEKVTIWYRCKICSCCLCSIPALERHSLNAHSVQKVELSSEPPPGALEGKIYYTYDTKYNRVAKPYPVKPLNGWTYGELVDKLEKSSVHGARKLFETFPDVPPSESDFPIRVKKLKDLIDSSTSSGDENEKEHANPEKDSSPPSPLDSPPDSGIHGSECHDDERQQPITPVPVADSSLVINQVKETSCNNADSRSTQVPSTATGTVTSKITNKENPPTSSFSKLPCTLCNKKFNNVSSLNFHTKKFHPGSGDSAKGNSQDKVILTIQRDGTGNFSSKKGSKNKPPEAETEDDDNSKKEGVRTRKRNISSESSIVTSTSQTKQSNEPLQTRLRSSRENSQSGNKKRRKSSYYDDSEYQQPRTSSNKNMRKFIVSDCEESDNESVSDASEVTTTPVKKSSTVRGRKKTRQSDIPDSPIAKNTRMKAAKSSRAISPSSSRSENESSTSELEISDEEKSDLEESDDDGKELTEKSTTSEGSRSPPSLTDYGSDDSDNLFTPVYPKKKQKKPKENQDCDNKAELATQPAKRSRPATESEVSVGSKSTAVSSKYSRISSERQEKTFRCSICSLEYDNPSSYIQHLYKAHKGTEMFYTCGFCEKRFSTKQDLSVFNAHIIAEKKALALL